MSAKIAPQAASKPSALYQSILKGITFGWSMIPLYAKDAPAVAWTMYQAELPTPENLATWFDHTPQFSAYAVICGQVSQLVVIDFDKQSSADEFVKRFSHLTKTRMVLSANRQLPHYYFKVTYPVATKAILGGEVRGEGAYVVGAGSVIDGKTWQLLNDVEPLYLHRTELDQILTVFNKSTIEPANYLQPSQYYTYRERAYFAPPPAVAPAPVADVPSVEIAPPPPLVPLPIKTAGELQALYRHEVQRTGKRNNALFFVACLARDEGYPEARTVDVLARLHAQMPPTADQPAEAEYKRQGEAIRTIASAYRYPAMPRAVDLAQGDAVKPPTSYLPNILRDTLLQMNKGAATLRTWEGLAIVLDIVPGDWFTEEEALEALQGAVGKGSIAAALRFTLPNGNGLFMRQTNLQGNFHRFLRPNKNNIFIQPQGGLSLPTPLGGGLVGSGEERGFDPQPKGRKIIYYQMPDPLAICRALDLTPCGSDPLFQADIHSAKLYRAARVRGTVERKPIQYYRQWMADRLGVSLRTIDTYHDAVGVQSHAMYTEVAIDWINVNILAPSEEEYGNGCVLMDDLGRRYKAVQPIARKLLKQGRQLLLICQEANLYYLGEAPDWLAYDMANKGYAASKYQAVVLPAPEIADDNPLPESAPAIPVPVPATTAASAAELAPVIAYVRRHENVAKTQPLVNTSGNCPDFKRLLKKHPDEFFLRPLKNKFEEKIAQDVYAKMPKVSLANARRWVYAYGVERVIPALAYTEWHMQKYQTTNPAGFLRIRLDYEWKKQYEFRYMTPILKGQSKPQSKPPQPRRAAQNKVNASGASNPDYVVHPHYGTIHVDDLTRPLH